MYGTNYGPNMNALPNILTWLRGFQDKIANFSSFLRLFIPKRDLDTKETRFLLFFSSIANGVCAFSFRQPVYFKSAKPINFNQVYTVKLLIRWLTTVSKISVPFHFDRLTTASFFQLTRYQIV